MCCALTICARQALAHHSDLLRHRAAQSPMRLAPLLLAASTRALRLTRRGVIAAPAAVAVPALAFDGQAYAGRTPQATLELRKSYQERVAADVKDFRKLGAAIEARDLSLDKVFFFFTPQPRSRPDGAGRSYGPLVDLVGYSSNNWGCGYPLAASFDAGRPPGDGPAVAALESLAGAFDPIRAAAKDRARGAAAEAYAAASAAFDAYLAAVGLPGVADRRYA